jgi:hypothetical protein
MSGPNSESSQSRSRSREPVRATGREGFGNVRVGGPTEKVIEELDESERAAQQQHPSSGLYVVLSMWIYVRPPDHMETLLPIFIFSGALPVGEAQGTLRMARYRTAKAPGTPMAPIIRMRRNRLVVAVG